MLKMPKYIINISKPSWEFAQKFLENNNNKNNNNNNKQNTTS